ncbi:cyclic nucleotide-binding domain-containing protein [Melittangium boletus]|uniref:Cyclic nucleotide-binding protein n=1 Tax=Melittangium boletus DSM 14713 TaxID=1294270 RepID=A0A250IIS9_9BACT|nr:cyclic nucleotide-binding domain-containing protein [Melittangium boletus]ATB31729.1 cyclic nucleotide-binding protein [Melittangium boletus DSM 14713]
MEKLAVVSSSQLFDMLSSAELQYLSELAEQRRYAAGELVFEEGELGDSLYVIVSGEVEVVRRDESGQSHPIRVLTAPEFFGEMSLIDKEYRSATVRARTEAELLKLTAQHLATFRQAYRDGFTFVVINIARILSARVREANARLTARQG